MGLISSSASASASNALSSSYSSSLSPSRLPTTLPIAPSQPSPSRPDSPSNSSSISSSSSPEYSSSSSGWTSNSLSYSYAMTIPPAKGGEVLRALNYRLAQRGSVPALQATTHAATWTLVSARDPDVAGDGGGAGLGAAQHAPDL